MLRKEGLFNSDTIIGAFLVLFAILTFVPFYSVIVASLSTPSLIQTGEILLTPKGFTLDSYVMILQNTRFINCMKTTVTRTMLGVVVNLILQSSLAYSLSKKYLPGRRFFMVFIIFTMLFNGGIIPTYLIVKSTGLMDTIWALIIPGAVSTWNVILFRTFFEAIPESLEEAAKIDGANDIYVFIRIFIPLSMPAIATIGLFCAVQHWNSFMDAVIYITTYKKQVLQVFLRDMIVQHDMASLLGDQTVTSGVSSLTIRMASVVVSIIPIIIIYPFLQRFFMKGIMIGAVKG